MKKLIISLCALCLAGAASAQVTRQPLSEDILRLQKSQTTIFKAQSLDMQTAPARKAEAEGEDEVIIDSVATQSAYGGFSLAGSFFYWFLYPGQDNKTTHPCYEDKLAYVYGTGGFPTKAGSGEIGYRFATGPDTWYDIENHYPNFGVPYAAQTIIIRFPSTSLRHTGEDGNVYYDPMPFYFKLYNSSKVGAQQVLDYSNTDEDVYLDVVYPTDPEKYTTLSETVMIEVHDCQFTDDDYLILEDTVIKAEFQDVDASQPLGNDFCVSLMFPIDWDEEGDSIIDPSWNAVPYIVGKEWDGPDKLSDEPHCTYIVHDFRRTTHMWESGRPENHERSPYMVLDSIMQPNMRYAVLPMDGLDDLFGEPYTKLYYTNWTSLQSANKADRYVQVSPVPAVDYVNFISYTDMSRIEIYSLGGQLVKAVNVSGDSYRLDIAGLNSGMYVARIYSEKGISSKKLIVR